MIIKKFENFADKVEDTTTSKELDMSSEKYKGVTIDGLEYPISERSFDYLIRSANSQYAYASNSENFHNKKNIRVYNHTTKEHYYLENVVVEVGDEGLLFVDFPKTDGPRNSWSERATQVVKIRTWGREEHRGEFVRYEITEIDKDNYCRVDDGYNKHKSGWYARDCFYKVIKIINSK